MIRAAIGMTVCLHSSFVAAGLILYEEQAGRIVMEVESHPPTGAWGPEKALEGFTGAGYYTWRGPNSFRGPTGGVLSYLFEIKTPGTYQLRIRNRHDFHDSTEQNDCFTRMDGGKWVKTFSSKRGEWNFRSNHEHSHKSKPKASYELKAGKHVLQIAGRSQGFSIDRIHLYREGDRGAEDAELAETRSHAAAEKPRPKAAPPNPAPAEPKDRSPNLAARITLAKRFLKSKDVPRAKRILTALIDKYPDAPEAREAKELLKGLD